ncbi:class I SAM-dependent methyltransferase [Ketobacter sp.]
MIIRLLCVFLLVLPYQAYAENKALKSAIEASHRVQSSPRDEYRHPYETLMFFGVEPSHHVVEIWPGASGWYTEILAPYLKDNGQLYAAQFNENSSSDYFRKSRQRFEEKTASQQALYSGMKITTFDPPSQGAIAPAGSVDRVLTFRNIHNWYMRGGGEERLISAFKAFFTALKPGGILGVVEHRLPESRPIDDMESSGYMQQSYVVNIAKKAGFELLESSEINANSKDSAQHPEGVWTLPPSLRLGEKDRKKYLAIGESDRMTLKFVKPRQNKSFSAER